MYEEAYICVCHVIGIGVPIRSHDYYPIGCNTDSCSAGIANIRKDSAGIGHLLLVLVGFGRIGIHLVGLAYIWWWMYKELLGLGAPAQYSLGFPFFGCFWMMDFRTVGPRAKYLYLSRILKEFLTSRGDPKNGWETHLKKGADNGKCIQLGQNGNGGR